jgi:hypothetical protein
MQVKDFIEGWPGIHQRLAPLILFSNFLDDFDNSVRVNGADAVQNEELISLDARERKLRAVSRLVSCFGWHRVGEWVHTLH